MRGFVYNVFNWEGLSIMYLIEGVVYNVERGFVYNVFNWEGLSLIMYLNWEGLSIMYLNERVCL